MKNILSAFILFFLILQGNVYSDPFLFSPMTEQHIEINNRILAKVNGKAISVIDIMKKMDMLFYRQFPEFASSLSAKYQFYQANWKHLLREMIDKELILADAAESKLVVSGGDVRQEMESLFGPNIISNLDQAGLTFDEAYKMVLGDITIRRMMYVRVHSKAMKDVTPLTIKKYYEEYAKENIRDNEWVYQVISIRDNTPEKTSETAKMAYELLSQNNLSPAELSEKIKEKEQVFTATINVSEDFTHREPELSDAFREILSKLTPNTYSEPVAQKSRTGAGTVFRIFMLKSMKPGGVIPFAEIEGDLEDRLLDMAVDKESEKYFAKLRQHFDVQQIYSETETFEPFVLGIGQK